MKHSALFVKVFVLAIILSALLGLSAPYLAFAQDIGTPTPTEKPVEPTPEGAELLPSTPEPSNDAGQPQPDSLESPMFDTLAASPSEVRGYWEFENSLADSSIYGNYGTDNPLNSARYEPGNCGIGLARNGNELPIQLQNLNSSLFPGRYITIGWL